MSIALAFRGQVQQAVVYDPTRNDLFYASKGRGAFLNDKRLRVSKRMRLAECLIGTGFPFRKGDNFKRYLQMLETLMPQCAGLRRPARRRWTCAMWPPATATASSRPACSPWDIAAGSLMVTEAGGLIGNFTGEADYLYQREVVAGNPQGLRATGATAGAVHARDLKDEPRQTPACGAAAPSPPPSRPKRHWPQRSRRHLPVPARPGECASRAPGADGGAPF